MVGLDLRVHTNTLMVILHSNILTGIMCLYALLCVYIPLINTRVKELEVKKEQRLTYL